MTHEEATVVKDVIGGTILSYSQPVYVLIDTRATHSFVAIKFENKLSARSSKVEKIFLISTL
jgi:hypothetical protein